jgi:hypothetical protein
MRKTQPARDRLLRHVTVIERGCWIWTGGADVYGSMWYNGRHMGAHRASYLIHHGPIPDGMHVCHRCDTPLCVNPDHLFIGSRRDNMHDASVKGRTAQGHRAGAAKLTWEAVGDIRRANPRTEVEMAAVCARYGINRRTLYRIVRRETWLAPDERHTGPAPVLYLALVSERRIARVSPDAALPWLQAGYQVVPSSLRVPVAHMLARRESATVSGRSGGMLSRWMREAKTGRVSTETHTDFNVSGEKAA